MLATPTQTGHRASATNAGEPLAGGGANARGRVPEPQDLRFGSRSASLDASRFEAPLAPPKENPVSTTAHRLIDAFLAGDTPSAAALLAPDATFHSPIRSYAGADQIDSVWRAVAGVVQNAHPTSLHDRAGETIAFFAGTIRDQPVDGVVRTLTNAEDRVSEITLMIRPWAALKAGIADINI